VRFLSLLADMALTQNRLPHGSGEKRPVLTVILAAPARLRMITSQIEICRPISTTCSLGKRRSERLRVDQSGSCERPLAACNRATWQPTLGRLTRAASAVIEQKASGYNVLGNPRPAVTAYVASHELNEGTYPSLAALVRDISDQVTKLRVAGRNAGGCGRQYAQRHVSSVGGDPLPHEGQGQ
jgi:hypothetical protein